MPFFVAIRQEAWPEQLPGLLAAIRKNFASSATNAPARHSARVFQRLNEPTSLLSIGEWTSQADYELHRWSADFQRAVESAGPRATVHYLDRLHHFERMNERAGVVACATITLPRDRLTEAEAFLLGPTRRNMVASPALVSRELYRFQEEVDGQRRLLVVHSWRSLQDLEHFRSADALQFEQRLREFGGSVERFTGQIAVEYVRAQHTEGGNPPGDSSTGS